MHFLFPFFLGPAFLLLGLAGLAFTIWMLVDAIQRPEHEFPSGSKVPWLIGLGVGLVFGLLGFAIAIAYYVVIRKPLADGRAPAAFLDAGGRRGRTCATCGEPLGTHARYCQNCGTPVGED